MALTGITTTTGTTNVPIKSGSPWLALNPSLQNTYIESIYSKNILVKYYTDLLLADIANTQYEGDIKGYGNQVIFKEKGEPTIRTGMADMELEDEVIQPIVHELLIDQIQYFNIISDDILDHQTTPGVRVDDHMEVAAKYMKIAGEAQALFRYFVTLAGNVNSHNRGTTAGRISGTYDLGTDVAPRNLTADKEAALDLVKDMCAVLDENDVPRVDRWLLVPPSVRRALYDTTLSDADKMGDSQSQIRTNQVMAMMGFKNIYTTNLLPKGALGKSWAISDLCRIHTDDRPAITDLTNAKKREMVVAGTKDALTYAMQISKLETHIRNPRKWGDYNRGLMVWGAAIAKGQALAQSIVAV